MLFAAKSASAIENCGPILELHENTLRICEGKIQSPHKGAVNPNMDIFCENECFLMFFESECSELYGGMESLQYEYDTF